MYIYILTLFTLSVMADSVPENAIGGTLHIDPITGAIGNQLTSDNALIEATPRSEATYQQRALTKARSNFGLRTRLHPAESKNQLYGKRKTTYLAYRAGQRNYTNAARAFSLQKAYFDQLRKHTLINSQKAYFDQQLM